MIVKSLCQRMIVCKSLNHSDKIFGKISSMLPFRFALQVALKGYCLLNRRGYAVASDDGGHENPMDSSFGREQQARLDYAFESTPETARVARQLIAAYYGNSPAHAYSRLAARTEAAKP